MPKKVVPKVRFEANIPLCRFISGITHSATFEVSLAMEFKVVQEV